MKVSTKIVNILFFVTLCLFKALKCNITGNGSEGLKACRKRCSLKETPVLIVQCVQEVFQNIFILF